MKKFSKKKKSKYTKNETITSARALASKFNRPRWSEEEEKIAIK
jgi:hypothetical protein